MSGAHRTCEACGIKERHCTEKRFFASFPLDVNRCKEWVKMVGNEDLAYLQVHMLHIKKYVCEAHFSKRDFARSKKRLKKVTVPNLNLRLPPLRDEILDEFLQINPQADVTPQGEVQAVPSASMPTSSNKSNSLQKTDATPQGEVEVLAVPSSSMPTSLIQFSCLEKTDVTPPGQVEVQAVPSSSMPTSLIQFSCLEKSVTTPSQQKESQMRKRKLEDVDTKMTQAINIETQCHEYKNDEYLDSSDLKGASDFIVFNVKAGVDCDNNIDGGCIEETVDDVTMMSNIQFNSRGEAIECFAPLTRSSETTHEQSPSCVDASYFVSTEAHAGDDQHDDENKLGGDESDRIPSNRTLATNETAAYSDLDSPAFLRTCRICLALDVKMYPISDRSLLGMYETLTGKQRPSCDKLPRMLCWECVGRLTSAHRFRDKALKSHQLLQNICVSDCLTVRDLQSIKRAQNGLESTLAIKHPLLNTYIQNYDTPPDIQETSQLSTLAKNTILKENGKDEKSFYQNKENFNLNYQTRFEVKRENMMEERSLDTKDVEEEMEVIYIGELPTHMICSEIKLSETETIKRARGSSDDNKTNIVAYERANEESLFNENKNTISYECLNKLLRRHKRKIVEENRLKTDSESDSRDNNDETYIIECTSGKICIKNINLDSMKTDSKVERLHSEKDTAYENNNKHNVLHKQVQRLDTDKEKRKTNKAGKVDSDDEIYIIEYNNDLCDTNDEIPESEIERLESDFSDDDDEYTQKEQTREASYEGSMSPADYVKMYRNRPVLKPVTIGNYDIDLFTITNPTYEEQLAEIKRSQLSSRYLESPYKCPSCYRAYNNRRVYEKHLLVHDEKFGAYECFICNFRYKTPGRFRSHLITKHSEKIICNKCTFTTNNRSRARSHAEYHAGVTFQCSLCPLVFDKQGTYLAHLRLRHASKYVCELCGYTFINEKGVIVHKQIQHRHLDKNVALEGPYCGECDVQFLSAEAHARHLKLSALHTQAEDSALLQIRTGVGSEEEPPEAKPVTCEQCKANLPNYKVYALHFRRSHPGRVRGQYPDVEKRLMCELCGKTFMNSNQLTKHQVAHHNQELYRCDDCGKTFVHRGQLYRHIRTHEVGRQRFDCPECGKFFSTAANRSRHKLIHTGQKSFKCEFCIKAFKTQAELNTHTLHVHLKRPRQRKRIAASRMKGLVCDEYTVTSRP